MLTIKADKLSHIQKEFNELFPFLKLEFFQRAHKAYEGSAKALMIKDDLILNRTQNNKETIAVNENMLVSELENLFLERFGISAQVFRKSGNMWLETTMTDDWTLKRQNDEGMELSIYKRP